MFCNLLAVPFFRYHLTSFHCLRLPPSWNLPRAKDELWFAHSDKIALQVAEGMLHASNLSRNVAKSRGSFYFSCKSQRNNCVCKLGCCTWISPCNLQRNVSCVANCKKNCFVSHCLKKVSEQIWMSYFWFFFYPRAETNAYQCSSIRTKLFFLEQFLLRLFNFFPLCILKLFFTYFIIF